MRDGITFKLEGIEDLTRVLNTLPIKIENGALKSGLRQGAQLVRKAEMARLPRHSKNLKEKKLVTRAGRKYEVKYLRNAIEVKSKRTPAGSHDIRMVVTINKDIYYVGRFLEYGTVERVQRRTGRRTGRLIARPFIRPAFEENKRAVVEIIISQIHNYLRKKILE